MEGLAIVEFTLPGTVDERWRAFQRIEREHNHELIGGPEWDVSDESALATAHSDREHHVRRFLAYLDGEPVGKAHTRVNHVDSPELAFVFVCILPEYRGRGIGNALAEHVLREAAGHRIYQAWAECPIPRDGEEVAVPPTGAGAIPANSPALRLALRHGFKLGQVERVSRYDFAEPAVDPAQALAEATGVAGEHYEIIAWEGAAGDDLLPGLAVLRERMYLDPPSGEMTLLASHWDVARMRQSDAERLVGNRMFRTVARHRPTGEIVALNELMVDRSNPKAFVDQWDTIVLPDHRGRRLGMAVKAANLLAVRAALPGAKSVMTWNAEENRPMLAVNEALGYYPVLVEAAFERRADA